MTEREQGATLQAIADRLTEDGVAGAQGGRRWYPSTVRAVLQSAERPIPTRAVEAR